MFLNSLYILIRFVLTNLLFYRELVKLNTELEKKSSTIETFKLENKELKTTIEQNKIKFDEQIKCLKLKFAENEVQLKNNLTDQDLKFNNKIKLAEEKCREDSIDLKNNLEKVKDLLYSL